jgi:peroxiredoxin Q/BCP
MKRNSFLAAMVLASSSGLALGAPVKVGDRAPDFALSDAEGRTYKLSDYRGKSAVVLEFFRSGGW